MMLNMTEDECRGLNIALNEATWLDCKVNPDTGRVALLLDVLSLPAEGPPSLDNRTWLLLSGVRRVAASLRAGRRGDPAAAATPLTVDELSMTVRRLRTPIFGWQFVDPPAGGWEPWRDRLSLDLTLDSAPSDHVLQLSAGTGPVLDARFWFCALAAFDDDEREIPLAELIAGGARWWEGMTAADDEDPSG